MKQRAVWLVVLILTMGFTSEVHAFFESYGAGFRANAMGGAFTAVADDVSAVFYNPAGLAQIKDHKLSVAYIYGNPNFEVIDTATGNDLAVTNKAGKPIIDPVNGTSNSNDLMTPIVGIALNVNKIISPAIELPLNTEFGFLAGVPNNATKMTIPLVTPDLPTFMTIGSSGNHQNIYMALSMEILKDLAYIGGGTTIRLTAFTDIVAPNAPLGADNPFLLHGLMGFTISPDKTFGVLVTPFDKMVRIGFNYKDEHYIEADPIKLTGELEVFGPIPTISIISTIVTCYRPPEYNFGIAVDLEKLPFVDDHLSLPLKHLVVSLDVSYRTWSEFSYDIASSYWMDYDKSQQLSPGTATDPDFKDTIAYKLGLIYYLNDNYSFMAGYQQYISPVPDQSHRVSNYIDMDRNTYSIGGAYAFSHHRFTLSGFLSYTTADSVHVDNTDVNGNPLKGITWAWEADPDIAMSSFYVPEGSIFSMGIGMTVAF